MIDLMIQPVKYKRHKRTFLVNDKNIYLRQQFKFIN
jgi:hypothetical protein